MITTLKEAKTKLSEMVSLAASGEDVVITVRGKPRAKLSAVPEAPVERKPGWKEDLKKLHVKYGTGNASVTSEEIISQLREERF